MIDEIAPQAKDYDHRLIGYNNDPATTFADIQQFFSVLESHISERLKEDPVQAQVEAARLAEYCAATEIRIAKRVREVLDSPSKWDRAGTETCSPTAVKFSLYCAFEKATREVIGDFDGGGAAMNEARNLISETAPNRDKYHSRLIDFNNDPTVTFDDVSNLLRTVEERITRRQAADTKKHQ